MAEEKFGIDNLKKVIKLGVALKTWYDSSNADKKIELSEIFALLPQLMVIPDLIASKDAIVNEAKDLSFDEVTELTKDLAGVTDANVIGIVIDGLNFIVAAKNLVDRFV